MDPGYFGTGTYLSEAKVLEIPAGDHPPRTPKKGNSKDLFLRDPTLHIILISMVFAIECVGLDLLLGQFSV